MNKTNSYQIGQTIKVSKRQCQLFADRVIVDQTEKKDNEFVFAELEQDNIKLYFVAENTLNSKVNNIGFWHTLFLNGQINLEKSICYQIKNKQGDGQYLLFQKNMTTTGVILANSTPDSKNNKIIVDPSIKNIYLVLTPKQRIIRRNKKHNLVKVSLLIIFAMIFLVGDRIYKKSLKEEKKVAQILAHVQGRDKDNIQLIKNQDKKEQNYLDNFLPKLVYLASQEPIWQGNINFFKKQAQLFSNEKNIVDPKKFRLDVILMPNGQYNLKL